MSKVLITGGSEGIGYAFAKRYAEKGDALFLCARSEDKLLKAKEQLKRDNIHIISMDLSEQGSAKKLFDLVEKEEIDIVINNAGIGYAKESISIPYEKDEALITLNIICVLTLSKLFAQQMKRRGSGTILNIASTGAFQPGPYIASYYASKSFVLSYSEALAEEMKGTGVRVYCLCPGPVDTAFYEKSGSIMSGYHMSADECVEYALTHMKKKTVIIPGLLNRILRMVPSSIKMKAVAKMKNQNR